jgi:hypothetical protein
MRIKESLASLHNTTSNCMKICEGQIDMHHDHEKKQKRLFRVFEAYVDVQSS